MVRLMSQPDAVTGRWTAADIPRQDGRVALVTGASSGIGLETARALAERGATVILACRDADRAAGAAAQITRAVPAARIRAVRLDLASLASVRAATEEVRASCDQLDLLINNAGVMWPPRETTEDGFELQFGTNHLGHFAFTGALLSHLRSAPGTRIVTVSSGAHGHGDIYFEDLQWERSKYSRMRAYGQSKLANLMFTYELQRRLTASGSPLAALAAQPGGVHTGLTRNVGWPVRAGVAVVLRMIGQPSVAAGALPTLRAATDPAARGGEFYGPDAGARGYPTLVDSSARSHDGPAQRQLWAVSEQLTGVTDWPGAS
jgi:NAD(P)-dependent dehydrogenase (short-subunit alcohol dehydrogenase family)